MSYGIQVINDYGQAVVDGLYKNLSLVRRAYSTKTPRTGGVYQYAWTECAETIDISSASGASVVAVRPGANWVASNLRRDPNGQYAYLSPAWYPGGGGVRFEYAVFDTTGTPVDVGQVGLQVFNELGELTFDARKIQLSIFDVIDAPAFSTDNQLFTLNHQYCPDAFYILDTFSGYLGAAEDETGSGAWYLPMIRQISPNQCQVATLEAGGVSAVWVGRYFHPSPKIIVCKPSD
ncbi:hypothetical protein ACUYGA_07180 [Metapseudomonas otitidis]|uniref:hypothetical protein n=1 Tax=Metapseudomonas otitidis TaxID=319939 RepID=UPI00405553F4